MLLVVAVATLLAVHMSSGLPMLATRALVLNSAVGQRWAAGTPHQTTNA
jgi:hypothetical protein